MSLRQEKIKEKYLNPNSIVQKLEIEVVSKLNTESFKPA